MTQAGLDRAGLGSRLRRWVADLLPAEFQKFPVIVSELNCEDTGCDCRGSIDRTATEIAILLSPSHRLYTIKTTWDARVHKELVNVTFNDLRLAMEQQLGLGVGLDLTGGTDGDGGSRDDSYNTAARAPKDSGFSCDLKQQVAT